MTEMQQDAERIRNARPLNERAWWRGVPNGSGIELSAARRNRRSLANSLSGTAHRILQHGDALTHGGSPQLLAVRPVAADPR